jgi:hypothetical protein
VTNRIFREKGSDFVGRITTKANLAAVTDRILASIDIRPDAFPGTRLAQIAPLYERYRFRKFNIRYVPAVPTSIGCQLQVYQDLDPNDDPTQVPTADALIRQAAAQTGAQQFNFFAPHTIPLAQRGDDQFYYTGSGGDKRFSTQARVHIIQNTAMVAFDGTVVSSNLEGGTLFADWECDFQTPQINPEAAAKAASGPCQLNFSDPTVIETDNLELDVDVRVGTFSTQEPIYLDLVQENLGDPSQGTGVFLAAPDGTPYKGLFDRSGFDTASVVSGPILVDPGVYRLEVRGYTAGVAEQPAPGHQFYLLSFSVNDPTFTVDQVAPTPFMDVGAEAVQCRYQR